MNTENETQYVLGLDLDNTIAQYTEGLRTYMMANYGYQVKDLPEPIDYSFQKSNWPFPTVEDYLQTHIEAVAAGLFRSLRPMPGAVDALKILKDEGVHIHVVTHRLLQDHTYQMTVADTVAWLDHNHVPYHSLGFTSRKDSVRAHSYVEDSPSNIAMLRDAGMKVFTFDKLYNRDIPGDRIKSWEGDALDKILAHKSELGL